MIFAFIVCFWYSFIMIINTSTLIQILASLSSEWEYADSIRKKIEWGEFSDDDLQSLSELIESSLNGIENESVRLKMKNILFQISIIHLEEWEIKKEDREQAEEIISKF